VNHAHNGKRVPPGGHGEVPVPSGGDFAAGHRQPHTGSGQVQAGDEPVIARWQVGCQHHRVAILDRLAHGPA
jgi:hypothetical protein